MKSEISFLSEQLRQVYNGDPWYGTSIKTLLQSFAESHAFDQPATKLHCAAELVAHIIAYRQFLNNRLGGDDNFPPDQEATFNWKAITKGRRNAWEALKDQLAQNQSRLLHLLAQQDDTLLDKPVEGKSYDFRYLIYGIIQHDIYHLGQISYINRFYQQNDRSGVKIHKSSLIPDIRKSSFKKEDTYTIFSYEGMAYSK